MKRIWAAMVIFAMAGSPAMAAENAAAVKPAAEKAMAVSADDPSLAWGGCPEFFPPGCNLAVLRGDPAAGGADALLKVPAGYVIPAHWHTSAEHMILTAGEMDVTYEGQPTAKLKPGMFAYGPSKLSHDAACKSGPCVLYIHFASAIDAHPTAKAVETKKKLKK